MGQVSPVSEQTNLSGTEVKVVSVLMAPEWKSLISDASMLGQGGANQPLGLETELAGRVQVEKFGLMCLWVLGQAGVTFPV